jgi:hypothetical protein
MLKQIEQSLQIAGSIGRKAAATVLSSIFGNMVRQLDIPTTQFTDAGGMNYFVANVPTLTSPIAYVFSAIGVNETSGTNHRNIPIPIRDFSAIGGLLNSRSIQRNDAFGVLFTPVSGNPYFAVYSDKIDIFENITLTYLPYPVDPATQAFTDRLGNFQLSMMNSVIGLATLFAKIDDQESGSLERFVPQLMETHIAGNINVNDNPAQ